MPHSVEEEVGQLGAREVVTRGKLLIDLDGGVERDGEFEGGGDVRVDDVELVVEGVGFLFLSGVVEELIHVEGGVVEHHEGTLHPERP